MIKEAFYKKYKWIKFIAQKSESYGSVGDKVAGESGSFEFVHFREVEIQCVKLGGNFTPEAWLISSKAFPDVGAVKSRISNDIGVKFSRKRTSVAPSEEDGVENTHTEEVHSAGSHASFCPTCIKERAYLESTCYRPKRRGTWRWEWRRCRVSFDDTIFSF